MQIKNTISNLVKNARSFFFFIAVALFIVTAVALLLLSPNASKTEANEPTIDPIHQMRIDKSNAQFEAIQLVKEECSLSRHISAEELKIYTDKKLADPTYIDEKLETWSKYMGTDCNAIEVDFL